MAIELAIEILESTKRQFETMRADLIQQLDYLCQLSHEEVHRKLIFE